VTVFASDHPEDFASIRMGCGWVQEHKDFGMVAVDHEQEAYAVLPAGAQRQMARDDAEARRQRAEWAEGAEERDASRAFRWRTLVGELRTPAELIADTFRRMDRADRQEEARVRAAVLGGEVELAQVPAPSLRTERLAMERAQRERAEARSPEQVRLDELQAQVTQLKSKVHALGG
jgi:hypothetical protein